MSDRTLKDPPLDAVMMLGDIKLHVDPTMPRGTVEARNASPPTDDVIRGLEKMRNESRSIVRAQRIDAAIARIQADDAELAKADRRAAEQERIIAAQCEKLEALRAALAEACDVAAFYCGGPGDDADASNLCREHAARIAELRKAGTP